MAFAAQVKEHARKRLERIADVGKAENQPVSVEVMEVAEEEIARLQRDVQRLQTWYDNLKAADAEKDDTLQSQSERIGDLVADVWRLEGQIQTQEHYQAQIDRLTHRLENQAQTIRVQAETIARLETEQAQTIEMLKDGNSAHVMILRGDIYLTRRQIARLLGDAYQDLFNALENTDINRLMETKEPPLPPETANVPDVPVAVHTPPNVRRAGGE
jgi:predicted RNase H-like nuclease (RuvC/YqgF family)